MAFLSQIIGQITIGTFVLIRVFSIILPLDLQAKVKLNAPKLGALVPPVKLTNKFFFYTLLSIYTITKDCHFSYPIQVKYYSVLLHILLII